MRPIDYRNATWADIQAQLTARRLDVLEGLRRHGPCTTRELAAAMGWDILHVRPRVTELVQLGFAEVVPTAHGPQSSAPAREGVYRARTEPEAWDAFHAARESAINPQLDLHLHA